MKDQKQITMYDFIEQPIKKSSTDVNKAVDKKNPVIESRIRVCIVRR
ncbi:hypothetical protein ACQKOF_19380 [Lysinibacillus sp. NPDC093190]